LLYAVAQRVDQPARHSQRSPPVALADPRRASRPLAVEGTYPRLPSPAAGGSSRSSRSGRLVVTLRPWPTLGDTPNHIAVVSGGEECSVVTWKVGELELGGKVGVSISREPALTIAIDCTARTWTPPKARRRARRAASWSTLPGSPARSRRRPRRAARPGARAGGPYPHLGGSGLPH
jgi:hypothetical protein